jgi:hypothetical protein
MNDQHDDRDTLREGEHHPAAYDALQYVKSLHPVRLSLWMELFASCAIEGNRMAEVCAATLERVMRGEGVGERYILGLAWYIRSGEEKRENPPAPTGTAPQGALSTTPNGAGQ